MVIALRKSLIGTEMTLPPLLFLHGLFGSHRDWGALHPALDLPGHGSTPYTDDILGWLQAKLTPDTILVGYSMGGRLALQCRAHVRAVVAISAHIGLDTPEEIAEQEQKEAFWQEKILSLTSSAFFEEWYAQPLFSSLSSLQRESLIATRSSQNLSSCARVMHQLRLSRQQKITAFPTPTLLIAGEKDRKYRELYRNIPVTVRTIEGAGHACLVENPEQCFATLTTWLEALDANP